MTENNLNPQPPKRTSAHRFAIKAICFTAKSLKAASEKDCLMADYYRSEAGKYGVRALIIKQLLRQ